MISLTEANNALKDVYLDVIANQLNTNVDVVLGKIVQTTSDVYGKQIIVLTHINGKDYQLKSELANIYGKIEITDKAIRVSQNSAGAFVNLLNNEIEQLVLNTSRQLTNAFYGEDKPHEYMTEKEKKQYKKLMSAANIDVEYIYLLDNWFRKEQYADVLDYIHYVGCDYYFEYIPLTRLGLPVPPELVED